MKLSEAQRLVIAHARLDAEQSYGELATKTGLAESVVKTTLHELVEMSALQPTALIDVYRLGYVEYDLLFSLGVGSKRERERFVDSLRSSTDVSYIIQSGGAYQYQVTVSADSPVLVDRLLQKLGAEFGASFIDFDLCICLGYSLYAPKFLHPRAKIHDSRDVKAECGLSVVDDLDRRILAALARAPQESIREIAESMSLAHSTVSYRVAKLRKANIYLGTFWIVSSAAVGLQSFRIFVRLRGVRSEIREGMQKFCREHLSCTYLIEYVGAWHFVIGIIATDTTEATEIVNEIYDGFGKSIDKVSMCSVSGVPKFETFPFGQ